MIKSLPPFFISIVIFSVIGIAGCCNCGKTAESVYPPTTIRISEGGGVTGQFVGYTIAARGDVSKWWGFAASIKDSTALGALDPELYETLLREVYAVDLSNLRHDESGNMTTVLEITSGELRYRYSWSGMLQESTAAPPELRAVSTLLSEAIQFFRSKE